jgi:short-subunit dehydrogenase
MAKTIVITGASSGFGKGVARKLGAQGHNVVLAARREYLLDELVLEIGENAIAVPTDVANPDEIRHLAERAIMDYGRIDVWINNAGVGAIGPFSDIPLEDLIAVVQTNFIGEINGSYVALRQFLDQGEGTLINVASVAGKVAMPYYAVYGATKSAVLSMGSAIRRELELSGHTDIHICAVNPWATDTPFFEHAIVDLVDNPKDEVDVSIKTVGSVLGSHLAPGFTEAASAKMTHKYLMEDAPASAPTSGSVHEPMSTGTGVEGQARERIAAEDEQKGS